jgi:hypothetical protein
MNNKDNDLFNNPMTRASIAALSDEDKAHYKAIGQELYGSIDFEASQVLNSMPPPMSEASAYVIESVKSGLHPSMLEENELELLKNVFGKLWYEKYGYVEKDLTEITTLQTHS